MGYAALQEQHDPSVHGAKNVNIHMLVNIHGDICLVHDEPFPQIPLWVKYRQSDRIVQILFDNGTTLSIDWKITDDLNSWLVKANSVNVVRTEQNQPVEGWETKLINDTYN